MKVTQILKEEITWSDVQAKYSGNTILLQMIMKAGQEPRNQVDGKTDWGSAIDLGSANYQLYLSDESKKRANAEKNKKDTDKVKTTKVDTGDTRTQGAQMGNQNARKYASISGVSKIDFTSVRSTATTSYNAGRALGSLQGDKITYGKKGLKLAASKKNPNNKL